MTHDPQWTIDPEITVNCKDCNANCCKHIAVPIEEPSSPEDYAAIRHYLAHDEISVYKDSDGDWLVEFRTKCDQLSGNRCQAYKTSHYPSICKEYEMDDCVMNAEEPYFEVLFEKQEDVDAHCRKHGIEIIPHATEKECVTLGLPPPDCLRDFDDFGWYVAHRDVMVYERAGEWYIHFNTTCKPGKCALNKCHLPPHYDHKLETFQEIKDYCKAHGWTKEEGLKVIK